MLYKNTSPGPWTPRRSENFFLNEYLFSILFTTFVPEVPYHILLYVVVTGGALYKGAGRTYL